MNQVVDKLKVIIINDKDICQKVEDSEILSNKNEQTDDHIFNHQKSASLQIKTTIIDRGNEQTDNYSSQKPDLNDDNIKKIVNEVVNFIFKNGNKEIEVNIVNQHISDYFNSQIVPLQVVVKWLLNN